MNSDAPVPLTNKEFVQQLEVNPDMRAFGAYQVTGDTIVDLSKIGDVYLGNGKFIGILTIKNAKNNQVFDAKTAKFITFINDLTDPDVNTIISLPNDVNIISMSSMAYESSNDSSKGSGTALGVAHPDDKNLPKIFEVFA